MYSRNLGTSDESLPINPRAESSSTICCLVEWKREKKKDHQGRISKFIHPKQQPSRIK